MYFILCLSFVSLCVCEETMQQLQLQLIESDRRIASCGRKFNKMQSDYRNLVGITADLVDSLVATVSGKLVVQRDCVPTNTHSNTRATDTHTNTNELMNGIHTQTLDRHFS